MHESKIMCGEGIEKWRDLVQYGVKLSKKELPEELEYYLVTLFIATYEHRDKERSFLDGPVSILHRDAQKQEYSMKRVALEFVGNACILRAGFSKFVSRNFKRICNNPRQYYTDWGITSFWTLHEEYETTGQRQKGVRYRLVADNLPLLVEILSRLENNKLVNYLHRRTVGNVTYL